MYQIYLTGKKAGIKITEEHRIFVNHGIFDFVKKVRQVEKKINVKIFCSSRFHITDIKWPY